MNKGDLIEKIAAAHGISKTAAGGAIDTFIDAATSTLKKGSRVTLVGFGTFSVGSERLVTDAIRRRAVQSKFPPNGW